MRRGSVPSQYPLDRGMPVFPHHGDNEPHRGQAGTAYQDNGWAIEQGLADVRALTEHWVACTVGAGAPRGVADATVALRLAYEVTFGIPASRGTVGDVPHDLDFENRGEARGWPSRRVTRPRWVGWSFSDWSSACPRRDHPTDRLLPPSIGGAVLQRSTGGSAPALHPGKAAFPAELGFIPGFVVPARPQS
jgi:hypothetical protein